ncbi:MAG: hypothetical protein BWK80_15380 [Desulfobacteraceae bacterium IS3]|nr:MAG: hypothetical protein BWK80_15380 [Desulfobacteraceae bacterium IS3]
MQKICRKKSKVDYYKIKEYLIGEKEAELSAAYSAGRMFVDKKTKYTGSWMKRLFGKVEEKRETSHLILICRQKGLAGA